jgi:L-rhamnonate dehydratase
MSRRPHLHMTIATGAQDVASHTMLALRLTWVCLTYLRRLQQLKLMSLRVQQTFPAWTEIVLSEQEFIGYIVRILCYCLGYDGGRTPMVITDVETVYLRSPQVLERTDSSQDALLVRVFTDAGLVGIGEVDSCPTVVSAVVNAPMSHTQVHGLRSLLIGENPLDIRRLWDKMWNGTLYYGRGGVVVHAMAGIEMALWDIKGKALGVPVHQLLGGSYRTHVPAYASYMFDWTPEATAVRAKEAVAAGFRAVKFGWEPFGRDPVTDEAFVASLRRAIGDDTRLMIDAGLAWDAPTAIERCRRFEPYNVFWIEEPVPPHDLVGYGRISSRVQQRIAAGEQETTVDGFIRLMDVGKVSVVQIDLSRVGFTQALDIAAAAARRGLLVCNHGFTTGVNVAAALHFLAAIPNALMLEYCAQPSPLTQFLVKNRPAFVDGSVVVPQEPGLGVEIDWDFAAPYVVK